MFIFKAVGVFIGLICYVIGRAASTSVIIEHHHRTTVDRHKDR